AGGLGFLRAPPRDPQPRPLSERRGSSRRPAERAAKGMARSRGRAPAADYVGSAKEFLAAPAGGLGFLRATPRDQQPRPVSERRGSSRRPAGRAAKGMARSRGRTPAADYVGSMK